MNMKTKHAPFSLYKKRIGDKQFWYVRYWNPQLRKYAAHRATGVEVGGQKERRSEAEKAANDMLPSVCMSATHMNLVQYVTKFWNRDSDYFRELESVQQKKASGVYIQNARAAIRLHIEPYPPFSSIGLDGLTAGIIRDYRLWLTERGLSGKRVNRVLQSLSVPMRYLISRDEAKVNPFDKIKPAAEKTREKGALTPEEARALIVAPVKNIKHRLAVMLGLLCGMRQGEVCGLRWEDIEMEKGVIHIRHNYQRLDGLKGPKCGSERDVPLHAAVAGPLASYRESLGNPAEGFVLSHGGKPYSVTFFRAAFRAELDAVGIPGEWKSVKEKPADYVNRQAERNLTFHSLRHTFVSLLRLAGINDFEIQALAGHKSAAMMDMYSHPNQVVEIDKCKNKAEAFLPAPTDSAGGAL
jgi:integrase